MFTERFLCDLSPYATYRLKAQCPSRERTRSSNLLNSECAAGSAERAARDFARLPSMRSMGTSWPERTVSNFSVSSDPSTSPVSS